MMRTAAPAVVPSVPMLRTTFSSITASVVVPEPMVCLVPVASCTDFVTTHASGLARAISRWPSFSQPRCSDAAQWTLVVSCRTISALSTIAEARMLPIRWSELLTIRGRSP
jgi:hypothetical protein